MNFDGLGRTLMGIGSGYALVHFGYASVGQTGVLALGCFAMALACLLIANARGE